MQMTIRFMPIFREYLNSSNFSNIRLCAKQDMHEQNDLNNP